MSAVANGVFNSQVDGLAKIYVYDNIGISVYFEFESEDKVQSAARAVLGKIQYTEDLASKKPEMLPKNDSNDPLVEVTLSELIPESTQFVCGYSAKQIDTLLPPIRTSDELISLIHTVIKKSLYSNSFKKVPVVKVGLNQLRVKGAINSSMH